MVFLPESGAGGCLLGVLFLLLAKRNMQLLKSGAVFYSSIDVDIGFLEWTRLETILLFLDFTVTYSALRANCSNDEKVLSNKRYTL